MNMDPCRPNILVFFTDQQRADTLGIGGCKLGLTPHLDRYARRGTFFKNAVTPQPVCGPARSCLQTGQFATTTGVWGNGGGLKSDSPKLAQLLADSGYRTAYMGKWHLSTEGDGPVPAGQRAGYQDWLAANCVELTSGPYSAVLWDEQNREVHLPGYRVDALTDAMIRYLQARAQDPAPFLLISSFLEPHHQNTDDSHPAPNGYADLYADAAMPADLRALGGNAHQQWAGYCGMIKRLDEALGRTMDALESLHLAENTIVIFLSDHGSHFRTRTAEYKRSPHEASIRVPFALWGPKWNGGGERHELVSLVDLMPTLLECAGVGIPAEVQGRSLLPLCRNENINWPESALIQFGDGGLAPGRALRTHRWKYAVTAPQEYKNRGTSPIYDESHLYDLRADPHEMCNLFQHPSHREVRRHLQTLLLEKMAAIGEPSAVIREADDESILTQRTVDYPHEHAARTGVEPVHQP